jgi:hypothetical protein
VRTAISLSLSLSLSLSFSLSLVLGFKLRSLELARQELYHLNHSLIPLFFLSAKNYSDVHPRLMVSIPEVNG